MVMSFGLLFPFHALGASPPIHCYLISITVHPTRSRAHLCAFISCLIALGCLVSRFNIFLSNVHNSHPLLPIDFLRPSVLQTFSVSHFLLLHTILCATFAIGALYRPWLARKTKNPHQRRLSSHFPSLSIPFTSYHTPSFLISCH